MSAHVVFGDMGADLSPFPYALIYPQDEHERLLIDRLAEAGVRVERQTELVAFEETAAVCAPASNAPMAPPRHARLPISPAATARTQPCARACRSAFRAARTTIFSTSPTSTRAAPVMNGELHGALDTTDFLLVFPLKDDGRARLIGTVRTDAEHQHDDLSWNDVSQRVIEWMRIDVERVHWFSTYRVHHRVADQFRKGRTFLLGDAAHIHSPVGGQGMNTGIGDAVNLAWKIADVVHGRADSSLLDSYEPERIAFARRLVATTDQAFTGVTSDGAIARRVRLNIVPAVAPALFSFKAARRFMFRTISQTAVHYRGSSLSEGRAGSVHGGDRLPWVPANPNDRDNFTPLTSLDWQVHVYGDAAPSMQTACDERKLPLHVFPWRPEMAQTGLRRNAVYLVRPDGYVALADAGGSGAAITSYLDARHLIMKR